LSACPFGQLRLNCAHRGNELGGPGGSACHCREKATSARTGWQVHVSKGAIQAASRSFVVWHRGCVTTPLPPGWGHQRRGYKDTRSCFTWTLCAVAPRRDRKQRFVFLRQACGGGAARSYKSLIFLGRRTLTRGGDAVPACNVAVQRLCHNTTAISRMVDSRSGQVNAAHRNPSNARPFGMINRRQRLPRSR